MMENLELIIEELIGSSEDIEDMTCEIDGNEYCFVKEEVDEWAGDGKWQTRCYIAELVKNDTERLGVYFSQCQHRSGSYFSDYYWEYGDLERVKKEMKTIVVEKWVVYNE